MIEEKTLSGFDSVKITAQAIASIAYIATSEIEGVKFIAKDYGIVFSELIGLKKPTGILVKFDKNNEVRIKISLIVLYGYNIPEVATKVQENVYQALERMAGVNIKDIDINVRGVEK